MSGKRCAHKETRSSLYWPPGHVENSHFRAIMIASTPAQLYRLGTVLSRLRMEARSRDFARGRSVPCGAATARTLSASITRPPLTAGLTPWMRSKFMFTKCVFNRCPSLHPCIEVLAHCTDNLQVIISPYYLIIWLSGPSTITLSADFVRICINNCDKKASMPELNGKGIWTVIPTLDSVNKAPSFSE
ncbi:hypothetical protein DL98DRAFT_532065 [Cadophora sp. DSE1049]|nr:hypothetical protein DL98DRAFT_532065 [Cadophora sp. DSE1049]